MFTIRFDSDPAKATLSFVSSNDANDRNLMSAHLLSDSLINQMLERFEKEPKELFPSTD